MFFLKVGTINNIVYYFYNLLSIVVRFILPEVVLTVI